MKSFDDFWKLLSENPIWLEQTTYRFYRKDVKKCAGDAFVYLLAEEKMLKAADAQALRKYVTAWLIRAPDAPIAPQLQQPEPEPVVETDPAKLPIPKSDPRYQEHLQRWLDCLEELNEGHKVPVLSKKEIAEEGGWIPKKKENYTPVDPFMFYLKEGVSKFSGKKYKGMITFPGFAHYDFGLVSVYSDSKSNAEEILKKAQRYSKMKVKKLSGEL